MPGLNAGTVTNPENLIQIPPLCLGDANGDGMADFDDITAILANWGATYSGDSGLGDATHDGVVDFVDITQVLVSWGAVCP